MVPSTSDSGYTFTSKLHPPRGETQRDDGCGSSKISRKWFTDWLTSWRDKDVIKVVTGIRRCGKTTLFELFREQLVESGLAADRIIAINFEDPDCASFAS